MLGQNFPTEKDNVHILELRRLLYELKDLRPDIRIRFRLIGAMWQTSYSSVIRLTEQGAVLTEEKDEKPCLINLIDVMQFEIETKFQQYEPLYHYNIKALNDIYFAQAESGSLQDPLKPLTCY